MAGRSGHRAFGNIETRRNARTKKVSGYRARYIGPDGQTHPHSFGDKLAAEAWSSDQLSGALDLRRLTIADLVTALAELLIRDVR